MVNIVFKHYSSFAALPHLPQKGKLYVGNCLGFSQIDKILNNCKTKIFKVTLKLRNIPSLTRQNVGGYSYPKMCPVKDFTATIVWRTPKERHDWLKLKYKILIKL